MFVIIRRRNAYWLVWIYYYFQGISIAVLCVCALFFPAHFNPTWYQFHFQRNCWNLIHIWNSMLLLQYFIAAFDSSHFNGFSAIVRCCCIKSAHTHIHDNSLFFLPLLFYSIISLHFFLFRHCVQFCLLLFVVVALVCCDKSRRINSKIPAKKKKQKLEQQPEHNIWPQEESISASW